MMSLTFGLFTQVSGSGPFGPLVYCKYVILQCKKKSTGFRPNRLDKILKSTGQTYQICHMYVALCTRVLPRLFKLLPWVDLDLFYAKVKFGDIGFCMGKSENYILFGNCYSYRPLSWFKYSNK